MGVRADLLGMEWWDTVRPADMLRDRPACLAFCPDSFTQACADARGSAASFVLSDPDCEGPASCRGWKLLLSLDRLLFGGLQGGPGRESTLNSRMVERFELFWKGQWQTLWLQSSPARRGDSSPESGPARAKRITCLIREQHVARGISALLSSGAGASGEDVAKAFRAQCGKRGRSLR